MLKKTVVLIVIVLLLFICFVACSDNNSIWYEVKAFKSGYECRNDWNLKCIISSSEGIESIKEKYNNIDELNGYDEAFFEEKSLLLYLFVRPHSGDNVSIDSIQVMDNVIKLSFLYKEKKGVDYMDVEMYWACIIEVNNEDIINCNQIIVDNITKKTR